VLKAISRSTFDLQTVLDSLARSAAALAGADLAVIYFSCGDVVRAEATFGCRPEFIEFMARTTQRPGHGTAAGRVFLSGEIVTIPDVAADPDYRFGRAAVPRPPGRVAFILCRKRPGPFTRRQSELTQTFADQAVIAIENARLVNELQARTKELAASLDDLPSGAPQLIEVGMRKALG
jgi:two-component system NtrC family sensor kinase